MESIQQASSLIADISRLLSGRNDASRKKAVELSKELTRTLETPDDTAVQLSFVVCTRFCTAANELNKPDSGLATEYSLCETRHRPWIV